jgi:hypothetical protein
VKVEDRLVVRRSVVENHVEVVVLLEGDILLGQVEVLAGSLELEARLDHLEDLQ